MRQDVGGAKIVGVMRDEMITKRRGERSNQQVMLDDMILPFWRRRVRDRMTESRDTPGLIGCRRVPDGFE